jgi:hypothetical protein
MKQIDIILEDLQSLGLRHISLNEFNDESELSNLCEKIKEAWISEFREIYNDSSGL